LAHGALRSPIDVIVVDHAGYAARRGCRPPTRYTDGCFGPDTLTFDVSLMYTQP